MFLPHYVFAHMDESDEMILPSKHLNGDIQITTDSDTEQWEQSFEKIIESSTEHLVSVKSINNSTHVQSND